MSPRVPPVLLLFLLAFLPCPLAGQDDPQRHPGAALEVQLLTMEPGDAIWERFGHNALRIVDTATGEDVLWNWGLFDFAEEGFMARLAQGSMRYWMDGWDTQAALDAYLRSGRSLRVQELALTPEQAWRLQQEVLRQSLPENRYYVYDYYRNNCSTMIRDALDLAVGGALAGTLRGVGTGTTYRWHTRRLLQSVPWAYAGIQFVLGNPADEEIDAWQETFLPMKLMEHVRGVSVPAPDGGTRPLVRREYAAVGGDLSPVPGAVRLQLGPAVAVGLAWALLLLLAAGSAQRGAVAGRVGWAFLAGGWTLLSGLAGLLLAAAWAFTDHVFWRWNENLLQMVPLLLLLLPPVVATLWRGRMPSWSVTLASAVAVASLLGFLLQTLPGFDQVNGEIIALALPVNLALALGARVLSPAREVVSDRPHRVPPARMKAAATAPSGPRGRPAGAADS